VNLSDALAWLDQVPPQFFAAALIAAAGLVWAVHTWASRPRPLAGPDHRETQRGSSPSPDSGAGKQFSSDHPGRERLGQKRSRRS
jgi:hypothetical protein